VPVTLYVALERQRGEVGGEHPGGSTCRCCEMRVTASSDPPVPPRCKPVSVASCQADCKHVRC
jgi:hypothetical protein